MDAGRSVLRWDRARHPAPALCAILHQGAARLGLVDHGEPFVRLRNQGMILAEEGTKMSKSRGTQVAPDELVRVTAPIRCDCI